MGRRRVYTSTIANRAPQGCSRTRLITRRNSAHDSRFHAVFSLLARYAPTHCTVTAPCDEYALAAAARHRYRNTGLRSELEWRPPTGTTPTVPAADNEGHSQPGKAVGSTRLVVGASKRSSASLGIDSGPPILAMLTAQEVVERLSGEPVRSRNRRIFLSRLSVVSKGSAKP